MNKIRSTLLAAAAGLAFIGGAQAATVSIEFAPGTLHNASAISATEVSSAAMAGMAVTMCFVGVACDGPTTWGTGVIGATGQDWSFAAGIDTFNSNFVLSVSGRALQSFTLYGLGALTVFDTVATSSSVQASPGSGDGRPFQVESVERTVERLAVTYFDKVYVGGFDYNDLYLGMRVSFNMVPGTTGFMGELEFKADTDRVATGGTLAPIPTTPPNGVPTPGTLALVGAGLLGLGLVRRRR